MKNLGVVFLTLFLLPACVMAEGAVRILDCRIDKNCNADGNCKADSGKVLFRMEPVNVDSTGAGEYKLQYGDRKNKPLSMQAITYSGPFYWYGIKEQNTLLLNSATQFLWHHVQFKPEPEATIRILTCSFIQ